MPTSSEGGGAVKRDAGIRPGRVAAGLLAAFAVAALLNVAFSFALIPYGSKSQLAWTEFEGQGRMDTVIVGTSLAAYGFDPRELDALAGTKSFSLATPGQTLEESFVGLRTAHERYGVSRAVLSVSSEALGRADAPHPSSPFLYFRSLNEPLPSTVATTADMLLRYGALGADDSLAAPFPWVWGNSGLNVSAIRDNVRMQFDGTPLVQAAQEIDPGWVYYGQGFGNGTHVYDPDTDPIALYFGEKDEGDSASADGGAAVAYSPNRVAVVSDICAYCAENDMQLVVIETPVPVYNVLGAGDFFYERHDAIADLFASYGAGFFDLNMAKPELIAVDGSCFNDYEHLGAEGARKVADAVAQIMDRLDRGAATDDLFFSEAEHRALLARSGVQAVLAEAENAEGGLMVTAQAPAGEETPVEYRFLARPAGEGDFQVVRDYGADASFLYEPGAYGAYDIRVEARAVGAQADYERFRELKALY